MICTNRLTMNYLYIRLHEIKKIIVTFEVCCAGELYRAFVHGAILLECKKKTEL